MSYAFCGMLRRVEGTEVLISVTTLGLVVNLRNYLSCYILQTYVSLVCLL